MDLRIARTSLALAFGIGVAAATMALPAVAQQPAVPVVDTAAPKPSCSHPDEFPGALASESRIKQWQKDFVAYIDCLKKFYNEQQALAKPHVDAANAAVVEYNKSVKEYNDTVQKAKDAAN
jgi:hypothetical protein